MVPVLHDLAQPWHALDSTLWHQLGLGEVKSALVHATETLRAEYLELASAGRLQRDSECLHAHDRSRGHWLRFEVTGFWHEDLTADGCSAATSAACALVRELAGMNNLRLLRAGTLCAVS